MKQKFYDDIKEIREYAWEVEALSKVIYTVNLYEISEISQGDFITLTEILEQKATFLSKTCSRKLMEIETV